MDDASTDGTSTRLERLGESRVRVVRHDACRGVARARNAGIEVARGEWVAFLDDDDLWSPRKLRVQLDEAARQGASFVYAAAVLLDEIWSAIRTVPAPSAENLERQLLASYVIPAGSSNVVARAESLRGLGGFDENLFQLADWDLWLRLAQSGRAAACDEVLLGYVVHPQNMLVSDRRDVVREFDYLVEKHRVASRRSGVPFDRVGFSRWVAGGHRQAGRRLAAARVYLASGLRCRNAGNVLRAGGVLLGGRKPGAKLPRGASTGEAAPAWVCTHPLPADGGNS